MKRRLLTVLVVLLSVCFALTGCGASSFSKVKVEGAQNTNYTVYSNGGNAVAYGNYMYFINGTRGYEDADAKQNQWGNVIKGALYRAELTGNVDPSDTKEFITETDKVTGFDFKSFKGQDYNKNAIDVVKVQKIAPKTIGTSGYAGGGIFIFDDYVYYASPNNEKDKTGTTQIKKTDFMRSKLDGSKTELIYKTDADSSDSPYKFYKQNGAVYLVSYYASKIVSVKMTQNKIEKPIVIAENVTSVIFPDKPVYNKDMTTNSPEDFIYYTRSVKAEDSQRSGNVVEVVRPSGAEGGIYLQQGKDVTLDAVRDGMVFYRIANASGTTVVKYDNIHNYLYANSASYKAFEDGKTESQEKRAQLDGNLFTESNIASYTTTYCFRPNLNSNVSYMLGVSTTGVFLFSNETNSKQILNKEISINTIDNGFIYYTDKDALVLKRKEIFSDAQEEVVSHADMVASGLKADVAGDFVIYFAKVDEWADGYAYFKKVRAVEGGREQFVGTRQSADLKPNEKDAKDEDKHSIDDGHGH